MAPINKYAKCVDSLVVTGFGINSWINISATHTKPLKGKRVF